MAVPLEIVQGGADAQEGHQDLDGGFRVVELFCTNHPGVGAVGGLQDGHVKTGVDEEVFNYSEG